MEILFWRAPLCQSVFVYVQTRESTGEVVESRDSFDEEAEGGWC